MSEEKLGVTETEPVAQEEEVQQETKELPEMSCGYVVGIKPDGGFVFEIVGPEPGLVQLLGLHKYADHRLKLATDMNQGTGFPLVAQQQGQLSEMLRVILNMLTSKEKSQIIKP